MRVPHVHDILLQHYFTQAFITTLFHSSVHFFLVLVKHWGKADDRNYNYGHPKMADVESGKNGFCRLNCFYNIF